MYTLNNFTMNTKENILLIGFLVSQTFGNKENCLISNFAGCPCTS